MARISNPLLPEARRTMTMWLLGTVVFATVLACCAGFWARRRRAGTSDRSEEQASPVSNDRCILCNGRLHRGTTLDDAIADLQHRIDAECIRAAEAIASCEGQGGSGAAPMPTHRVSP